MSDPAPPRTIPVFVVVPPRTLLLDIAGPMEVLRKTNLEQQRLRFVVRYVGPTPETMSSIGLALAGIEPLPDTLPQGAMVVLPGAAGQVLGAAAPAGRGAAAARGAPQIVSH